MPRRMPRRPVTRVGSALLTVAVGAGTLAAGLGVGYTVTQPALGDGSAFLARGHTVVHVNGESGRSDAEVAMQLATGSEELQTVRLPDGRLAVVNKKTGTVTYLDAATLTPGGAPVPVTPPAATAAASTAAAAASSKPTGQASAKPTASASAATSLPPAAGQVEPIATSRDGYLVNTADNTVTVIPGPGQPATAPVRVADGILAVVPAGESAWVLTGKGDVIEVLAGQAKRTVHLGEAPAGITVADGHPVVVTQPGSAYTVDGDAPRLLGPIGVTGNNLLTGSWRGAGRYAIAVDPRSGRLGALDPRTRHLTTVDLPLTTGAQLGAPVVLDTWAYVPEYTKSVLLRVNLKTGRAEAKPLEVPGRKGRFTLEVTGGRVWANNQYDQRALLVDADGHEHYVDKGASPDVTDSQSQNTGDTTTGQGGNPGDTGSQPAPGGTPSTEKVAVPSFAAGTNYKDACARLVELKLRCGPVADGTSGGATGSVKGTDPPAGTQVLVNSRVVVRYVSPVRTPTLAGLSRSDACRAVRAAKLTCAERPDRTAPVASPDLLERVTAQNPAADRPADRNATVTITFPVTIALPDLTGQTQGEACQRVQQYKMRCVVVVGVPATRAGQVPGAVYGQNPAAGTVAATGDTVTVTVFAGDATVGTYTGLPIDAACAAVEADGFACVRAVGRSAAGTGQQPGVVYAQSPAPGTVQPVRRPVTLTFYSSDTTLPDVTKMAPDAACAALAAQALDCARAEEPNPSTNVVFSQDPPPGTVPIGTRVTIHYSPWGLVNYWIYQHNSLNVWVLRAEGNIPAGYGRQQFQVGLAYAPGTALPGGLAIHGFSCTTGGTSCNGISTNHFYSRVESYPGFDRSEAAVFFDCARGGRAIYRTWNAGMPRFYGITSQPPADPSLGELLGCVW
ncbi:PASTA domain-containing protein [Dactylosporangium sp. NPDC049525]|uniref:PASTA domain-containing protein n=1 Tax=Dactylosporangium sp. NPDC049525 TaxID=3154730 RepID=UPI003419D513